MPDPSAGEVGGIFAALVALLATLGGGIAWLVGRKDRSEERQAAKVSMREAKLDAWHKELLARERQFAAQQAAFQARIDKHLATQDEKIADLEGEIEKYRAATASLVARLAHHDPADPVLTQVAKLLGDAFPFAPGDFERPTDELLPRHR